MSQKLKQKNNQKYEGQKLSFGGFYNGRIKFYRSSNFRFSYRPLSVTDKLFQNNRVNDSSTEMSGQLRTTMFIGVALIEAVPI